MSTLTEYGDFECPYCGNAYPDVKRVRELLGDRLTFEFRHFPIESRHPHAFQAAEAAEAARAQGRFEEMHDLLFENQRRLERDDLVGYARQLGLDAERFERDLDTHAHEDKIRADQREALERGVAGTPTFFVNGELYEGFYDSESLAHALG